MTRLAGRARLRQLRRAPALLVEEPERFWPAVVGDLGVELARLGRVVDARAGSVDDLVRRRPAERRPDLRPRVGRSGRRTRTQRSREEDGVRRSVDLAPSSREEVTRLAEGLGALGVGAATSSRSTCRWRPRPRSPRTPRAVGAVPVPLFSGFAAPAVAARLRTRREGGVHRRRHAAAREAVRCERRRGAAQAPTVEHVVVRGRDADRTTGTSSSARAVAPLEVEAENPYLLAYTSGTTGRPEGRAAHAGRLPGQDRAGGRLPVRHPRRRRVLFAPTWAGSWARCRWSAWAPHGAAVSTEGAPDRPRPAVAALERHRLTMLGVSPTLVRALIPKGEPDGRPLLAARR